jgi:hypothetical protein
MIKSDLLVKNKYTTRKAQKQEEESTTKSQQTCNNCIIYVLTEPKRTSGGRSIQDSSDRRFQPYNQVSLRAHRRLCKIL